MTESQLYVSDSKELKENENPKHVGRQDPYYKCQAKITSTGAAPHSRHTRTVHTHLLTRRLILSPCKTTTM